MESADVILYSLHYKNAGATNMKAFTHGKGCECSDQVASHQLWYKFVTETRENEFTIAQTDPVPDPQRFWIHREGEFHLFIEKLKLHHV